MKDGAMNVHFVEQIPRTQTAPNTQLELTITDAAIE